METLKRLIKYGWTNFQHAFHGAVKFLHGALFVVAVVGTISPHFFLTEDKMTGYAHKLSMFTLIAYLIGIAFHRHEEKEKELEQQKRTSDEVIAKLKQQLETLNDTQLQDSRRRQSIYDQLHLIPSAPHHYKVAVDVFNGYALSSITNCHAYISLIYENGDIIRPPAANWQAHITPQDPLNLDKGRLRLCWSTHTPIRNPAALDICAGESQSLEVFKFDPDGKWIGILSERWDDPYRVFLRGNKVYTGFIEIASNDTSAKQFLIQIDLRNRQHPLMPKSESV